MGKQAEKLLDELAIHKASSEVVPHAGGFGESGLKGQYISRMRQMISVALQTAMSNRELGYAQPQHEHGHRGQGVLPIERLWDAVGVH